VFKAAIFILVGFLFTAFTGLVGAWSGEVPGAVFGICLGFLISLIVISRQAGN
jgi:hypothetical protein